MKPVRDIRPDLNERLKALAERREELKFEIAQINLKEHSMKSLLAEEEARWEKVQPALFQNGHARQPETEDDRVGRTPLARFLVSALSDRKPHVLKELVLLAIQESFDFGAKNSGRSIHFALVGLQQSGYVQRLPSGAWQWTGGEKQTAQR
jgi:hypothetical protein